MSERPPISRSARELSPLRKTTTATSVEELVREQLAHFSLDPASPLGRELAEVATHVYRANQSMHGLWDATVERLASLDRRDRIAFWNAKRFLCFQLAKLLDTLQNPMRKSWQSLTAEQRLGRAARAVRDVRQRDRDLQLDAGHHAHRDLPVRVHGVDRRRVPGEGAAARDLLAADEPDRDEPGELHRRRRSRAARGRVLRLELQLGDGRDRRGARAPGRLPRHRAVEPQRLRRRAPAPAGLVRQAQQPGHRGRVVRRLRGARLRARARAAAHGARASGSRRGDTSTCTSSRPATRTATCSTCRASAAPRTPPGSR